MRRATSGQAKAMNKGRCVVLFAAMIAVPLGSAKAQQNPFARQSTLQTDDEQADFNRAAQEASGSAIDFTRAFERFLQKYPSSPYRDRLVRSLYQASRDLKDNSRIVQYGEQLLAKDPNDISVLPEVAKALNSFEEPLSAQRALSDGRTLERLLRAADKPLAEDESPRDKGKRQFDAAKGLSGSLVIQADALGTLGKTEEAIAAAQKAFETLPIAESARSLAHWQAKAGHYDAAVTAFANAFAIADTPENHQDDRNRLTEYYLKAHKDEKGLGDIVLVAYDNMTALAQKRLLQYGNSPSTKPINFQLTTITGNRLPLLSLKGKVIVIDFWATWCQPCRAQHPLFEQVKSRFKDDRNIAFLEVDSAESKETVEPFLKQQGWTDGVYLDDGLTQALKIENLPTTILLDRKGDVYSRMVGFQPNTFVDLLTQKIQEALGAPSKEAAAMSSQGN